MTEPILVLGDNKWAIKENGILGYTVFDGFNNVDNYVGNEFVFTRNTSSNVINSQGLVENSCYNTVSRSENFEHAYWVKNNGSISANTAIAPNGTMTADKLIEDTTANLHYLRSTSSTLFGRYIGSIYVKAAERTNIKFGMGTGVVRQMSLDLITGAFSVSAGVTGVTENVGNGWWKATIISSSVFIANGVSVQVSLTDSGGTETYSGDGVSGVYIWGAQNSFGTTPRPYLKTTDRLNVPTIDYSLSGTPMYLLEPQRTNILIRSNEFDDVSWVKFDVSVTGETTISPTGGQSATLLKSTGLTNDFIYQQPIVATGITVAGSIYVKNNDATTSRLYMRSNLTAFEGEINWSGYNLTSVTLVSGTSIAYDTLPNNWYRIKYVCTINEANQRFRIQPDKNSNGKSIYIFGAQLEVGNNSTSYIGTSSGVVTRNADTSYVDLSGRTLLNQNNFTLYCEIYMYNRGGNGMIGLSDVTTISATNNIFMYSGGFKFYVGGVLTSVLSTMTENALHKMLIQVNGTSVNFYRDGVQIGTTQTVPTFNYRYLVVTNGESTYNLKTIELYDRTLTDAECITITT